MENIKILAVNPGSTSTKIAMFIDNEKVFGKTLEHEAKDLKMFMDVNEQLDYRSGVVIQAMSENGFRLEDTDVFVARGGGLTAVASGIYELSDLLVKHAAAGIPGQHPAQLGSQIVRRFADMYGGRAFIVNPPDVDEFSDVARVLGIKGKYRESHLHALNQKEIAIRFCRERGVEYGEANLIICHLGGGLAITAHEKGRMIDSNDIIKGSGPMMPTRAGDLPYIEVIEMAYSGEYTKKELIDKLNINGGLTDYFGTSDVRDVVKLIEEGDEYAEIIYNGMIYQIAKYIGSMAAALKGKVDAIILTGGVSNGKYTTCRIVPYIDWIAEVVIMPGEFELEALAIGALRAVSGEEEVKTYTGIPLRNSFCKE